MSMVNWNSHDGSAEQRSLADLLTALPNNGAVPARTTRPKSGKAASALERESADQNDEAEDDEEDFSPLPPLPRRPLHRLAVVREQQGVTLRNMARRMGKDLKTVRAQEEPYSDITLTQLYDWQRVLDVPVADLLSEDNDPLSAAVKERAQLVRIMKTAMAMLEQADGKRMERMVMNLIEQLLEIMPELREVGPWHTVGQRRNTNDIGRCGEQTIPDDFYRRAQN